MLARRTGLGSMIATLALAAREAVSGRERMGRVGGEGRSRRAGRAVMAAIEGLEDRRLFSDTTVLSTGVGPGGVRLTVDAMGAFGLDWVSQPAQYRDFSSNQGGVIGVSYVYFPALKTPLSNFRYDVGTKPDGTTVDALAGVYPRFDSATDTSASSSFILTGTNAQNGQPFSLQVDLTQTLTGPSPTDLSRLQSNTGLFQSTLRQTYRITNLLGTPSNFSLVRLVDARNPDITDKSIKDTTTQTGSTVSFFGATNAILDSGRTLLSVAKGSPDVTGNANFLEVQSFGGTLDTSAIKPLGLKDSINANNSLPQSLAGLDGSQNVNGFTTNSYVPSMAQQSTFALGARETTEYTTVTIIGEGRPIQAELANPELSPTPITSLNAGAIAFSASSYSYSFPRNPDGTLKPLTLTLNRGNTNDLPAVTATVSLGLSFGNGTIFGTTPSSLVSLPTSIVNFAAGQTSAQVTVNISDLNSVPTTATYFNVSVNSIVGTTNFFDSTQVYILPRTNDFGFTATTQNYSFPRDGNGNLTPLNITVQRRGTLHGSSSITLSSAGGSLPAGAVTGLPATLNFADGQSVATASISINPALAGLEASMLSLAFATSDAASYSVSPRDLTVNVLPQAPVFQISTSTFTATTGTPSVQVTISRSGNLSGPASVTFATTPGSGAYPATAGTDFTAVNQRLDFTDGQTSAVVTVPLLAGQGDGVTRNFGLALSATNAPTTGTVSVIGATNTATVSLSSPDVTGPTITSVTTQGNTRGITGILLRVSEPLLGVSVSAFQIAQRSGEAAFGAAKLSTVRIAAASYDPATNTVLLIPRTALAPNRQYQVSVRPNAGITDLAGNVLNSTFSNRDGSGYTAIFSRGTKISYVDRVGNTVTLSMRQGSFELIRLSSGDGQTLNLFGINAATSLLMGTVRPPRGLEPRSVLGQVNNAASTTLILRRPDFDYTTDLT